MRMSPARANVSTAQVCFTVLTCWLASGIVFGFAALKPVLIDQGVYRNLCTSQELEDDVEVCYEQELRWVLSNTRGLSLLTPPP